MGNPALFEARGGISIGVHFLSGDGAPGGAGRTDDAVKGSVYLDATNGAFYLKKTSGTGSDKWVRMQGQDDLNAALLGQSWRDPARLYDNTAYADLATAETAVNTGAIDSVTIAGGDRILFDNIAGAAKNVFIVTGLPGSGATLELDANAASKGDALYIQEGSAAGKQYSYNGTAWVQQGASSSTEIAFLQSFVGKSGNGSELPNYPSNQVVTDNDSLEKAIGDLDAEIGAGVSSPAARSFGPISDQAVNRNLQALDTAIGSDVTSTQQIAANASVNANLSALDAKVGGAITAPKSRDLAISDANSIQTNLQALDAALGQDYGYPGGVAFIGGSGTDRSVWANLWKLDVALQKVLREGVLDLVPNTWNVIATIYTAEILEAEYALNIQTTSGKVWRGRITVIHDKTASGDATQADHNIYSVLRLGGNISGLDFQVTLNDTGTQQYVALEIYASEAARAQLVGSQVVRV